MQNSDDHTLDLEDLVASQPAKAGETALPKAVGKATANSGRRSVELFDKFPRWL